jgi:hypothetical protein
MSYVPDLLEEETPFAQIPVQADSRQGPPTTDTNMDRATAASEPNGKRMNKRELTLRLLLFQSLFSRGAGGGHNRGAITEELDG